MTVMRSRTFFMQRWNGLHLILFVLQVMRILTSGFMARYSGRMLNIHPSPCRNTKGHTHARAPQAGDVEHGVAYEVTAALDDGPILGQGLTIGPDDTPPTRWQHDYCL
jgi:phosphoribosylglycinamide formyltransferase-1